MSVTSSIKAGQAFFEIMAEDKTAKGIDSAETRLRRFGVTVGLMGTALSGFAAAGLASIGVMMRKFAGAGDEISDAMNVTGLSSDLFQGLQFAAADAGVSVGALVGGLSKMNSTISKAAAKGKDVLGIDAKQLLAMDPDKRVLTLIDAIEKIKNPADRAAAAIAVFGKAGAKLLPAFEGGAEAVTKAIEEMKASGEIMSDDDRQLAVEAEGAFLSMGLQVSRVSQLIAAALAPAFLTLAGVVKTVLREVITFLDKNRALVATLGIGLGVIGAVGSALMFVGVASIALSFATMGLTAAWAALGTVLAFVTSPVFVITAAIVACGVAAGVAAYHLDQLHNSGRGMAALQGMATAASTSMQLLQKAIVNGEWGLAWDYIAASLEFGFAGAILTIKSMWSDLVTFMLTSMLEAVKLTSKLTAAIMPEASAATIRVITELQATIRQDAQANLADEQAAMGSAASRMAEIVKKITALGGRPAGGGLPADFGNIASSASGGIQNVQTMGLTSAAAAARINNSAPANQWQEKMLDNAELQTESLKAIEQNLDELEVLTVE